MEYTEQHWIDACERGKDAAQNGPSFPNENRIEHAELLLALAYRMASVACGMCNGLGHRAYGNTTTWRGGIGGQAITQGTCDKCWGTGRTDVTGVNLRDLEDN